MGNPAHDLVRLGLSLASAARGLDLPGVATALMLEGMMNGYEKAFQPDFSEETDLDSAVDPRGIPRIDSGRLGNRSHVIGLMTPADHSFGPALLAAKRR